MCVAKPEIMLHSLVSCLLTQAVWFASPLGLCMDGCPAGSFAEFLAGLLVEVEADTVECFFAVAFSL